MEALVEGDDTYPNLARIDELLSKGSAGELTREEQLQLKEFQGERQEMRDALLHTLVKLTVDVGLEHFFDLATLTLIEDIPEALSGLDAWTRDAALVPGWALIALRHDARSMETIEACLAGKADLGRFGMGTLLVDLARHRQPGGEELLERVINEGDLHEVLSALFEPNWLKGTRYVTAIEELLEQSADRGLDNFSKASIRSGFLVSVGRRENKAEAKQLVQKSIDQGHWSSPHAWKNWGMGKREHSAFVYDLFATEELEAFVVAGKFHPSLLR
jgi:hypothetical protein